MLCLKSVHCIMHDEVYCENMSVKNIWVASFFPILSFVGLKMFRIYTTAVVLAIQL